MAQSPSPTPIFPITLPLSATCPLPPSTAPVPPTMDQKTHQTSSPSTVSEEIWAVLVTVAGRRPRGRNGLILPAHEIDKAPTRLLRDLFNSHGLTKLEPCFDPSSGQPAGACLYLATFPSCAAVERAREEWHDAEFDNAFMTRIFLDIIEEDYTILSLLAEPSTPTSPKACIRAAAFVPAPPSNTFEEWWAKRDSKNWVSHQRNIEYLTNLRYRGVWLYQSYPEDPDPTSFSRTTPILIENEEDGRVRDELDEPVELIDWLSWQTARRFTMLPHTPYLVPPDSPASEESSPQSSDDDGREEKDTPDSSPTSNSPCLPNTLATYAAKELAQKKAMAQPIIGTDYGAQASNSGFRKRAASSSNGSAMDEPNSEDLSHIDEEVIQTDDTTHPISLIGRDKQAGKLKSRKRAASPSNSDAIDATASDDDGRQPPIPFLYAPRQYPKSISTPHAQFVFSHTEKYTDDSPQSHHNPVRTYHTTPDASPAALQCDSTAADPHTIEAFDYQYPHFVRVPSDDGDVQSDQSRSDTQSPASDATAIQPAEVDGHTHLIQPHSTDSQSDDVASFQLMVLHQPVAICAGMSTLIQLLLENESPYLFEEIGNISTQTTVTKERVMDPEEAWHAELTTNAASGEIEVDYVSASCPHRAYNDLSPVVPQLEQFAETLANHDINNDVVHDVPDYRARDDKAVQGVAVPELETDASSEVIGQETIVMEEMVAIDGTLAEPEAIDMSFPLQNASSTLASKENLAEIKATKEPVLLRKAATGVPGDVNDTMPTNALDNLEEITFEMIFQSSIPAVNETPDLWLKLLLLFLLAFFSQRLMLNLLQSPMLAIVLIMSLLAYIRNGGNGCAEQQMAEYGCGP